MLNLLPMSGDALRLLSPSEGVTSEQMRTRFRTAGGMEGAAPVGEEAARVRTLPLEAVAATQLTLRTRAGAERNENQKGKHKIGQKHNKMKWVNEGATKRTVKHRLSLGGERERRKEEHAKSRAGARF